jgi:hypothetical protein
MGEGGSSGPTLSREVRPSEMEGEGSFDDRAFSFESYLPR